MGMARLISSRFYVPFATILRNNTAPALPHRTVVFGAYQRHQQLPQCNQDSINNSIINTCMFHTSPAILKAKSKSKKNAKIQEVVRPIDVVHIVDLEDIQNAIKEYVIELQEDYSKDFHVGADLTLFEKLSVTVEGDTYLLNELAQVTKQSPYVITVDMASFPEYIKTVEEAIRNSQLNLNPSVTGTLIKVPIPQANAERRTAIAKSAKQRAGLFKVKVHELVKTTMKSIAKHDEITEDLEMLLKQQLTIYSSYYIAQIDNLYKGKEKEIINPS